MEGARGAPYIPPTDAELTGLAREVIKRLAHWKRDAGTLRSDLTACGSVPDVAEFCAALTGPDSTAAMRLIDGAVRGGAAHEDLCLHPVGASALRLSELWQQNDITYPAMTLAGGRMLGVLRDMRAYAPPFRPRGGRSALFATARGDCHVMGASMAASAVDAFHDQGWEIDLRLNLDETTLTEAVVVGTYPIVGLVVTGAERIGALAQMVVRLQLSRPETQVLVYGALVGQTADLALRIGADAAAPDPDTCVIEMERLHRRARGLRPARTPLQ